MRSRWKGKYITNEILSLYKDGTLNKAMVFSRDATILEEFVGFEVSIHNGLNFYPFIITPDMVSFKFGEFVFTKKTGTAIHRNQLKKLDKKGRK